MPCYPSLLSLSSQKQNDNKKCLRTKAHRRHFCGDDCQYRERLLRTCCAPDAVLNAVSTFNAPNNPMKLKKICSHFFGTFTLLFWLLCSYWTRLNHLSMEMGGRAWVTVHMYYRMMGGWLDEWVDGHRTFPKLNRVVVIVVSISLLYRSQWNHCWFLLISIAPKRPLQDLPKPEIMQKEELITVQPMDLSAREFVVYQYGLSILHLLIPQLHVSVVSGLSVEQSPSEPRKPGWPGRRIWGDGYSLGLST